METTLNVHVDILSKISRAAQLKSLSRSAMIILLIKKIMDDAPDTIHIGKMVRYQDKSKPGEWHIFHVRLRMDDYEYFFWISGGCLRCRFLLSLPMQWKGI